MILTIFIILILVGLNVYTYSLLTQVTKKYQTSLYRRIDLAVENREIKQEQKETETFINHLKRSVNISKNRVTTLIKRVQGLTDIQRMYEDQTTKNKHLVRLINEHIDNKKDIIRRGNTVETWFVRKGKNG